VPGENPWSESPLERVRVLYVAFTKGLFAAAPPGCYHWAAGEESEIYISDESPLRSEVIGKRPAISFTRAPVQFYSLGLGDIDGYNFETGGVRKSVLVPGVMSINCLSRTDLESERLAWIVGEHLWLLREKLMKMGFFEIGRQPTISATSPAEGLVANEGGEEWFCTSVQSPFQFPRSSKVTPLNELVLENIELQLRVGCPTPVGSMGWPASENADLPIEVIENPPPTWAPDATDTYGRTPNPGASGALARGKSYHPLNPTVEVQLKSVNPYRRGTAPLRIGGKTIPLGDTSVKESCGNRVFTRVKI
jgi:hypothetical protein